MKTNSVLLSLLLISVLAGCSYHQGGLISKDVKTVYVPIFQNEAFERGMEFDLTRALINELQRKTHLQIVSDRSRSQTELKGAIYDFTRSILNENSIDQPRELQITVTLRFKWYDLDLRRPRAQSQYFRETASARFEIGETVEDATREALRKIAQRVVEQLESPM